MSNAMDENGRERSEEERFLAEFEAQEVVSWLIESFGGTSELARRISASGKSIKSQAISQWKAIPIDRVQQIHEMTGRPKHELRPDKPDLFPPPQESYENMSKDVARYGIDVTEYFRTSRLEGRAIDLPHPPIIEGEVVYEWGEIPEISSRLVPFRGEGQSLVLMPDSSREIRVRQMRTWKLPESLIGRNLPGSVGRKLIVVPCEGTAMEPIVSDGDYVFVDTLVRTPTVNSAIYAIDEGGGVVSIRHVEMIRQSRPTMVKISTQRPGDAADWQLDTIGIIGRYFAKLSMA